MAGMGPPPKPAHLRQRRNRTSTAAELVEGEPLNEIPELPARGRKKWHPFTLSWWEDVRSSPMANEFIPADLHGLYLLADLVDQYWRKPSAKLAGEIRQQRTCFGLTPIDRRRLQWEVKRVEESERKRPSAPSRQRIEGDPRSVLQAVK